MKNFNLYKLGGVSLVISSVLSTFGSVAHPQPGGFAEPSPAQAAALVLQHDGFWQVVHGVLLGMVPIISLGFMIAYLLLLRRGERVFSTLGAVGLGSFGILSLFVFMLDGFSGPLMAHRYEAAAGEAKEIALQVFYYNYELGLVVTAVSFVALALGLIPLGISMLKAKFGPAWLGWLGTAIGAAGMIGYALNVFGPFWVYSAFFPPYIALFSLWTVILGVVVYRAGRARDAL